LDALWIDAWHRTEAWDYSPREVRVPYDGSPVTLVVKKHAVSKVILRFQKADGTPASNAWQQTFSLSGHGGGGFQVTSPTGIVERHLVEGEWIVQAAIGTTLDAQARFTVKPGEPLEILLRPRPPGRLEGTLRNGAREPIAGASVTLDNWYPEKFPHLKVQTDAAGRFTLDPLPPGDFWLEAEERVLGSERFGPFRVRSGEATTVSLTWSSRRR
jgi:hypothetical protein